MTRDELRALIMSDRNGDEKYEPWVERITNEIMAALNDSRREGESRIREMVLDRKSTAYGNMEGCDADEFIRWEARYVAMCELLDAIALLPSQRTECGHEFDEKPMIRCWKCGTSKP